MIRQGHLFLNALAVLIFFGVLSVAQGMEQKTEIASITTEMNQDFAFEAGRDYFYDVKFQPYVSWCGTCPRRGSVPHAYENVGKPAHLIDPVTQEKISINKFFIWPDGEVDLKRTAEEVYQDAQDTLRECAEGSCLIERASDYILHNLAFAAQRGHAQAQFELAIRLFSPRMVRVCTSVRGIVYGNIQSSYIAYYFFKLAANQGHKDALCCLGQIHYNAQNMPFVGYNGEKAYAYFHKAAEQGVPEAFYMLGEMYRKGQVVARNRDMARDYYEQAKIMGFEE